MAQRAQGKKKKATTLINGGVTPVVYTDEGHVLAAGERVEVETLDDTASALIERGYLTVEEPDSATADSGSRDREAGDTSGASPQESTS